MCCFVSILLAKMRHYPLGSPCRLGFWIFLLNQISDHGFYDQMCSTTGTWGLEGTSLHPHWWCCNNFHAFSLEVLSRPDSPVWPPFGCNFAGWRKMLPEVWYIFCKMLRMILCSLVYLKPSNSMIQKELGNTEGTPLPTENRQRNFGLQSCAGLAWRRLAKGVDNHFVDGNLSNITFLALNLI